MASILAVDGSASMRTMVAMPPRATGYDVMSARDAVAAPEAHQLTASIDRVGGLAS